MKAFLCNDFVNFLCAVRRRASDYMTIGPIAQSDNVGSGKHLGKQSINYHTTEEWSIRRRNYRYVFF